MLNPLAAAEADGLIYQDTDRWSADEVHGGELLFGLAVTSQG